MGRKVVIVILILLGGLLSVYYWGNLDEVIRKETETRTIHGVEKELSIWHMKSGAHVVIQPEDTYIKYSPNNTILEEGKLDNGKLVANESQKTIRWGYFTFVFVFLLLAYHIIWFLSQEFSPLQTLMDRWRRQKLIPFEQLSPEEIKLFKQDLKCFPCDRNYFIFISEEYHKKWAIQMAIFECGGCGKIVKQRRN